MLLLLHSPPGRHVRWVFGRTMRRLWPVTILQYQWTAPCSQGSEIAAPRMKIKEAAAPYFWYKAAAPTIKMKMDQGAWTMRMATKVRHGKQGCLNAAPRHFRSIVHCSQARGQLNWSSRARGQLNWTMKEAAAQTMKMKMDQGAWTMRMRTKARHGKQGWLNAAPRHFRSIVPFSHKIIFLIFWGGDAKKARE